MRNRWSGECRGATCTFSSHSAVAPWSDRGAALIELAFALPLIVMLVVGMVSSGIAYNQQLSLTHAAREGGRYAATLPVTNFNAQPDPMAAWLDEITDQTIEDATGSLDAGVPGRYVCVAYVHPNGVVATDRTARLVDGGSVELGQQCITGGDGRPASERRVQVVVGRDTQFSVVFFSSIIHLDAEGVSRYEAGLGF